ncbi:MAG TPA: hypothetical protein VF609_12910 [Flavisolibacter sp.]|jgi:hypothetical protein
MRIQLLMIFIFSCIISKSQPKEQLLREFLLGISVADPFQETVALLETSQDFGIDSIQRGNRIFSSFKGTHPFPAYKFENIVILLENEIWQDSITKEHYDTSTTYSIQYIFSNEDEKRRNNFYKEITKAFLPFYHWQSENNLQGNPKGKRYRFQKGQFDNFAEINVFRGSYKKQFLYVTIRFNKRKYYQIKEPTFF